MLLKIFKINLLLIVMLLLSCEQENATITPPPTQVAGDCGIRVKVVYHFCTYTFIQILDPQYYSLADDRLPANGGKSFHHVFMVNNYCEIDQSLTSNDLWDKEFEVNVIGDVQQECISCLGGYFGKLPNSRLAVRLCTEEEVE